MAGEVDVVLDRDRDPEQRRALTGGESALRLLCLRPSIVGADQSKAIQRSLAGLDPIQGCLQQLLRSEYPGGEPTCLLAQGPYLAERLVNSESILADPGVSVVLSLRR